MAIMKSSISGTIYDPFDLPAANLKVQAFDKDLRSEQLLGETLTDAKGFYKISYDASKWVDSDAKGADVFIQVISSTGTTPVALGESPVYFNVPDDFTLDYKIGNAPIRTLNEFDALVKVIKPLTDPQRVALADLQENDKLKDISFLANETGEAAAKIALLPPAFMLAGKTHIAADIFYGLFRLQYPTDLNALLLKKSESIADGIRTAIDENIISAKWGEQVDSIIQQFNRLATGVILSGADDQSTAFKQVMTAALPNADRQQAFVNVFLANENTPEKFWDALAQQPGFSDPKTIADVQSVLHLNLLAHYQPALTTLLFKEQQQNPGLKDLRGFASFSFDDWRSRISQLVAGGLTNFPDGITGDTPEEKATNYAASMTQLIKALYPTAVFASRLSKDTSAVFENSRVDLTTFFANNVDYDLKNNNINQTFAAANLTGIIDKTRLKNELANINRLYKLTDDYSHVSALRLQGIDSATTIVSRYTSTQFAERFAAVMPPETAAVIYKNAERIDNRSTILAVGIKMRNDIPIYAINGPTTDAPPDYASLFGDTNCDCEYCQSVYSPSAYFVDCLQTIRKYSQDAFDRLTRRRPDLTEILLTCNNTNTPLPYIDLVNELLENTIAPIPPVMVNGKPTYPHFQTTNTAEELLAYPEHVDTAAYDQLKTATSSFDLPLNLPLEETRLHLDKLGVKRHALMELFFGNQPHSQYADLPIASEYLQLSQTELNIINGAISMPVVLGKVSDFLKETGLSYVETLQLLECYFVNPLVNGERSIKVVAILNDQNQDQTTCNIEFLTLQSTETVSLKILPFIRLWKKIGWDFFELDRIFTGLGINDFTGDINTKLVIPLSHVARLKTRSRLNLSTQTIMTLWSSIDTDVYVDHAAAGQPQLPTQYENLFQNKRITNPIDPEFTNPNGLSGSLGDKGATIVAALNLTQRDFATLLQPRFVDGNLTLNNLSVLFRYATLARALKLSVDDLIGAIDLTGINPFGDTSHTADTLAFIDKVDLLRSSGFSIPELKGLLAKPSADLPANNSNSIASVLTVLRDGLKKIELLTPVGATPQDQAKNKLQNQNNFITETIGAAFKAEAKVMDVLINNLVKSVADNSKPAITPFIDAAFIASEGTLFTIDSSNIVTWAFPDVYNTYVVLGHTWNRISRLVSKLKISNDEFIYFQGNESALAITAIWNLPASSVGNTLFVSFENLVNVINFRNAFVLPTLDWFKLFDFVILNAADAKKNFIASLYGLSQLPAGSLDPLLGDATNVNDTGMLDYVFPADYLSGELLVNLINCAKMAKQLGSRPEEIAKLILADPSDAQETEAADLAKSLLKAKYDLATWLNILQPISNQLRVRKRDALTSYLLTSPETAIAQFRQDNAITDMNSLYAYFLIDLEMDACMLTSRIKQAISSTQLFVDRCLMNLETGIVLGADFTRQWNTWRNRYRIWEANRKIFLYPENWIEPELRDDKSPFFRELESQLKQNEITDQTAEDALRSYLEKLDTVANLEMVGVYPDSLTGIVHVIGRTRNIPHQYFYTKQINSVWSAWEKIDLDIEGDHILPVVWNNRLMLFWAQFTEKEDQDSSGFSVPAAHETIPPNPKYLEIKLAWSEYKEGTWKGKKISQTIFSTRPFLLGSTVYTPTHISLSSLIDGNKLYIRIYVPLRTDIQTDFIREIGGFIFDGCQGSPGNYIAPGSSILNASLKLRRADLDKNQLTESTLSDIFSVYDNGIYKNLLPNDGYKETTIFNNTPGNYQILANHHEIEKIKPATFFYRNERNNFYVRSVERFITPLFPIKDVSVLTQGVLVNRMQTGPIRVSNSSLEVMPAMSAEIAHPATIDVTGSSVGPITKGAISLVPMFFGKHYVFQTFYHPWVCDLISTLNTDGIEGLYKNQVLDTDGKLKDGIQNKLPCGIFIPNGAYNPTLLVQQPYPIEQADFSSSGLYSIYNWELFFHIPLLIATRLSQDQKFAEARKWFHYTFDPTRSLSSDISGPERFWIPKPFKEEIRKGILTVEELLNQGGPDLDLQLSTWESNPFNPHAVARLRISAYMRSTLTKYIDNLIAWGDQLFTRDTLETINEATLLYVLAANLLGRKPERVPARATPQENSFSTVQDNLDRFSNAKVAIQSFISLSDSAGDGSIDNAMMPLFCIPKNDMLLGYWDTVADRLFKIRHCLNIEGVYRQLPLFEPPIDPALLVKAAAEGLNLNMILNDMNAPLPKYRFQVLLQKANELCSDVKGLGGALLSALEKKDAEQLALLRSGHEVRLLQAVRGIKTSQVDEANENLNSLNRSKEVIQARKDYYSSREFRNSSEEAYFVLTGSANVIQSLLELNSALASIGYLIPQVNAGPFIMGTQGGGLNLGNAAMASIEGGRALANALKTSGELANILGTYQRRQDDWIFQAQSAALELKQVDKQIAAAEIRLAIAEKELANHDLQIAQSQEVDDFLNSKYTNEDLYDYMVGQISSVYFQSYQLAYDLAKRAERCFRFELGLQDSSHIQFGYWDSLKKGLLSGEKLQYDLRRLETAYLEQNRREFELTKSISLLLLDPLALVKLRETGRCFISLPEEIFDLDYPGHYFRRIKSVSITLPCVVGPYTTISCTLRLLKNSIRVKTTDGDNGYPRNTDGSDDLRFIENNIPVKAIAASHAQNDSGVFELSFRDERYLPFEGAGAISDWSLELFNDTSSPDFGKPLRQFDYSTIPDAILHVKYTAREDAGGLKNAAAAHLRDYFSQDNATPSLRMFNLRQEFPTQWHRFLNPANSADGNVFEFEMAPSLFPMRDVGKTLKVNTLWLLARTTNTGSYTVAMTPPSGGATMTLDPGNDPGHEYGGLHFTQEDISASGVQIVSTDPPVKWRLKVTSPVVENLGVEDIILVLGYEWE